MIAALSSRAGLAALPKLADWLRVAGFAATGLLATPALAVQQTLPGSLDMLLEQLELLLPTAGLRISDQAATDRFALIYCETEGAQPGSHVTLTLRQLPGDDPRTDVVIVSDTPVDTILEASLIRKLNEQSRIER